MARTIGNILLCVLSGALLGIVAGLSESPVAGPLLAAIAAVSGSLIALYGESKWGSGTPGPSRMSESERNLDARRTGVPGRVAALGIFLIASTMGFGYLGVRLRTERPRTIPFVCDGPMLNDVLLCSHIWLGSSILLSATGRSTDAEAFRKAAVRTIEAAGADKAAQLRARAAVASSPEVLKAFLEMEPVADLSIKEGAR